MGAIMNPDNWEHAKQHRNEHWRKIKAAWVDFGGPVEDFYKHLENEHGIKLALVDDFISDEFEIVDEHKYFLFVLKYT